MVVMYACVSSAASICVSCYDMMIYNEFLSHISIVQLCRMHIS